MSAALLFIPLIYTPAFLYAILTSCMYESVIVMFRIYMLAASIYVNTFRSLNDVISVESIRLFDEVSVLLLYTELVIYNLNISNSKLKSVFNTVTMITCMIIPHLSFYKNDKLTIINIFSVLYGATIVVNLRWLIIRTFFSRKCIELIGDELRNCSITPPKCDDFNFNNMKNLCMFVLAFMLLALMVIWKSVEKLLREDEVIKEIPIHVLMMLFTICVLSRTEKEIKLIKAIKSKCCCSCSCPRDDNDSYTEIN